MAVTYNTICLTQTAATVAALMDFPAPAAAAEPIRVVPVSYTHLTLPTN